ncbi:hypothetical protein ACEWY4_009051 [Coilia grayii]|uniref:Ig-like domain-containing protein n=1 Tax=Coilia grayii TaxID=363190 RepID=A0ABD1K5E1_9TELE
MKMTSAADLGFLVLILCGMGMSSAVRQVAVMEGQTLLLTCLKGPGSMDWTRDLTNNVNVVLFLNDNKGYDKDNKYSIHNFSSSEYTLSVSAVTFKDEGTYTCHSYGDRTTTRIYNVTVLGVPKITYTKHEGRTLIRCSVKGNAPATISWQFGNGIHLEARPQHTKQESNGKWITEISESIKILRRKVTVKCLLHNPSLAHSPVVRFVTIENKKIQQYSTQASITETTTWRPTSDIPNLHALTHITGKTGHTETIMMKTSQYTETTGTINTTSTLDSVSSTLVNTSFTTDNTTSITDNSTRNDTTDILRVPEKSPEAQKGSASLFITSVTALIICLLIVVTFLIVKLRREHVNWKLEKEESDQSVESGKSKSSGEENKPTVSLGFLKSNFRKYKAEKDALGKQPSASTSASTFESNSASASTSASTFESNSTSASASASASAAASHPASHTVEVIVENHTSNGIQHPNHGAASSPVKETEL